MKWLVSILVYLAIFVGLFWAHNAWVALFGFHLVIIVSLLIARPNVPLTVLFKGGSPKWIIISILFCGSSGVFLYFLQTYLGIPQDLPAQLKSIGLTSATWPAFIVYVILFNSFIEEYFWRAYLGSETKSFYVFDAIFAGFHVLILLGKTSLPAIVLAVVVLTFAGWFWRQMARQNNGLLVPVLGHMTADLSILLAIYRICIL